MGFPQSPVQLFEKSKKDHNSVKKKFQKTKKMFFLRSHNASVHAKNQISKSRGMGSRRRTKSQKTKKLSFCAVTMRVYMPKIRFLSQGVWAAGEGQKVKKQKNFRFAQSQCECTCQKLDF